MARNSKKGACSANVQAAKSHCLMHNRREGKVPSYINPHLTHLNRVVYELEELKGIKSLLPMKKQRIKLYEEKVRQKCQAKFTPFREDALRLKAGITDEQLLAFKEKVEKQIGWRVMGIWLHQDEGYPHSKYIEGDEDFAINYHAHVLYDCQDHEKGSAIRRDRAYFRLRQDILAESTGMERGNPASETGRRHRSALEQRIVAQEERIEELEAKAKKMQSSVGIGAQVGALFGVGELAEIRKEKEKQRLKFEEEIKKIQEIAEKKVREANEKANLTKKTQESMAKQMAKLKQQQEEEKAAVRQEGRREGRREIVTAICKAANLSDYQQYYQKDPTLIGIELRQADESQKAQEAANESAMRAVAVLMGDGARRLIEAIRDALEAIIRWLQGRDQNFAESVTTAVAKAVGNGEDRYKRSHALCTLIDREEADGGRKQTAKEMVAAVANNAKALKEYEENIEETLDLEEETRMGRRRL